MAEKRTINIDINNNAEEAAKDFQDFAKATNVANDSVKGLNKTFEEVYGELQPLTTRMGEAEDRLYELALAGDTTSKEYQELLTKVGQYRKVQIQTDLAVDSAATTLGQKLGGALTGATGGFAAIQGVMGLVGSESEQLEKALLKVQSALAIQQGVQGIKEAIPSFKMLGKTAMTALKGIRTGIAATGIGVFVVAIGTLVAYWDDIKEAIGGVTDEQKSLTAESEKNVDAAKENLAALDLQENSLRLQGKSEREILKLKIKKTEAVEDEIKANIENDKIVTQAQVEQLTRSQEMAESIARLALQMSTALIRVLTVPLDLLLDTANTVSEFLGFGELTTISLTGELDNLIDKGAEAVSTFLFDPEEVQAESNARIKEQEKTLAQLKSNRQGFELQINAIDKAAAEKSVNTEKKRLEDIDKLRDDENAKRISKEDAQFQLELDLMKDRQLAEIIALTQQYDEKFLIAEGNAELTKQLEEQLGKDIDEIEDKYRKLKADKDKSALDLVKANAEAEKIAVLQGINESLEMAQKGAAAIQALGDAVFAHKMKDVEKGSKEEEKLARKQFKFNKALQLGGAVIDAGKAITASLAQSPIAIGPVPNPAGIASLAFAATTSAANIAKIAASKFESPGSASSTASAGGVGGGGEPQAPQFNVVGDSGVNQLATLQQQPTMAYVVSGEVTTAQALDRNRVQNATL